MQCHHALARPYFGWGSYRRRAVLSRDCPNDSAAWKVEFYPHMRLGLTPKRPIPCLAPGVLRKCQFERRVVMTMKSRTVAVAAVSVCAICAGAISAGAVRETLPRPRRALAEPMGLSSTLHSTLNGKSNANAKQGARLARRNCVVLGSKRELG